jgi:hypothetical protein
MKSINKRGASGSYKIGFVQESAASLRKRSMAELGAGVYQSIGDVSYVRFLEWIRSERLTTLPHKGSRWDKVLIRALYFAEQLHNFEQAIQSFAHDSSSAAAIGYGHAQLLLEVRHRHFLLLVNGTLLTFDSSATRTLKPLTRLSRYSTSLRCHSHQSYTAPNC